MIKMEMHHIKLARMPGYVLHHQYMRRYCIPARGVAPQRAGPSWRQLSPGREIAACEQRYVMAQRHEFLGEERHDPLDPAIEQRRYRLGQRSDWAMRIQI